MKARELAQVAKEAAEDKKGLDPVILKIGKLSSIASYFLVVHGTSDRHVKTIAEYIVEVLEKRKERVWHCEGLREGKWVLLDYGDVVIHVFHYESRKFYALERLWGDGTIAKSGKRHGRQPKSN